MKYRLRFNWNNAQIEIRDIEHNTWIASFESESLAQIACDALNGDAPESRKK